MLRSQSHKGIKRAPINAESDDFREITATKSQVRQVNKPTKNEITNTIPKRVATPLPPLKFCQTGNKLLKY